MDGRHTYIAIDLKSFYASVECMERGLDPLRTCLTVADGTCTEKTICLAVSPALKSFGIPGRPRLFEVNQKVREVNAARKRNAPGGRLSGESYDAEELKKDPSKEADVFPIIKPVVSKMASIVKRFLEGQEVDKVYVVGGACCFKEFETVFEKELGIPAVKTNDTLLVTPLGIAWSSR